MNGQGGDSNPPRDGDEQIVEKTLRHRVEGHFLGTMASGFVVLIPLLVTILILQFAFVYIERVFRGEDGGLLTGTPLNFPGVCVIMLVVILYGMGLLVSGRVGRRRVVQWQGAVLSRIPIVRSIY